MSVSGVVVRALVPALVVGWSLPATVVDPGDDPSRVAPLTADAGDVTVDAVPLVIEAPAGADAAAPETVPDALDRAARDAGSVGSDEPVVVAEPAADRVVSPVIETSDFQTVGVTWDAGSDTTGLTVEARTRSVDGSWSEWTTLEISETTPDPGTVDAGRDLRGGTDPLWVGDADGVQVAVVPPAGELADVALSVVSSPPVTVAPASAYSSGTASGAVVRTAAHTTGTAAVTTAAVPTVVSRAQWGAAPQACAPDVAQRLVGAVVHHTAGSNAYTTQADAMRQIRNDQSYHINSRGWCDIGYNFIVDKWGNIYEGRQGSLTSPVIGVHAGGFNTSTVGISMLGNFDQVAPSQAMVDAVGRIAGLRLSAYGVNPRGEILYTTAGGENSRFGPGTGVRVRSIFGHRDVSYTACPGQYGYSRMDAIRDIAATSVSQGQLDEARALVRSLYKHVLGRDGDAGGVSSWSAALVSGVGPAGVATAFATSDEYAAVTVTRDYQAVLGRAPDATGMAGWTAAIRRGAVRSEDLRISLLSSDEFYARAGSTPEGFIRALYQHVLGRTASAGEVTAWAPEVARAGRGQIVRGFWGSWESATQRVDRAYVLYLERHADASGLVTWPPVLLARGEGELRSQLVSSAEYRSRALAYFGS